MRSFLWFLLVPRFSKRRAWQFVLCFVVGVVASAARASHHHECFLIFEPAAEELRVEKQ